MLLFILGIITCLIVIAYPRILGCILTLIAAVVATIVFVFVIAAIVAAN